MIMMMLLLSVSVSIVHIEFSSKLSHCIVSGVLYSNCTDGEVRLADGMTEYEGRVEVCIGGVWGSVCRYYWGRQYYSNEAYAVCHQLGYQGI